MKLRLRMKTWTDPETGDLYLISNAFGEVRGNDLSMLAYAMRDEETRLLRMTVEEWNSLSYKYFIEDGDAPKPPRSQRPDPLGGGPMLPH